LVLLQANIVSLQSQTSRAKDEMHGPEGEIGFQGIEDSIQDITAACSKLVGAQDV
jgi:hypothetical protein